MQQLFFNMVAIFLVCGLPVIGIILAIKITTPKQVTNHPQTGPQVRPKGYPAKVSSTQFLSDFINHNN